MNLVEFRTETGSVFVNPKDVVSVYEADQYRHRGPAIGIWLRGQNKPLLVYGDTPEEVSKKLAAGSSDNLMSKLTAFVVDLRERGTYRHDGITLQCLADEIEKKFLR